MQSRLISVKFFQAVAIVKRHTFSGLIDVPLPTLTGFPLLWKSRQQLVFASFFRLFIFLFTARGLVDKTTLFG